MDRVQVLALAGLLSLAPALAKPVPSTSVPAVVKLLKSQYKLPEPAAHGTAGPRNLATLVSVEQRHFPEAWVSGRFYDWRTTSKYRGTAGLHLGYDIAMPIGSPFSAAWPGTVVAIANWYADEYGITVESPDGTRTTYGHVAPTVSVGTHVEAGTVMGTITSAAHVDVKMRDAGGNYLDFGGDGKVPGPAWAPVAQSREDYLVAWLVAQNALDLAKEEQSRGLVQVRSARLERQRLKARLPILEEASKTMADYVEKGLVARVTAEQARQDLEDARVRAKKLNADAPRQERLATNFEKEVKGATQRVAEARKLAVQRGLTWKDVQAFVNAKVAEDPKLAASVAGYKKSSQTAMAKRKAELQKKIEASAKSLQSLEELYQMGGLPKDDIEAARERHRILLQSAQGTTGE